MSQVADGLGSGMKGWLRVRRAAVSIAARWQRWLALVAGTRMLRLCRAELR